MDTENALTNAKESPNEIFFEEEARLWAEVYGKQSDSYLIPKFCPLYASSGRKYK